MCQGRGKDEEGRVYETYVKRKRGRGGKKINCNNEDSYANLRRHNTGKKYKVGGHEDGWFLIQYFGSGSSTVILIWSAFF